jgi:hypothetical protein
MSGAEFMRCIIEAKEEAVTLAECDQRTLERFQLLDAMESEDEKERCPVNRFH